jgi:L-aminopeptidase/D-esterase-like protein
LTEIHGLVLTGGSAFGLAAAQGVMEWLAERGVGYQTPVVPVPIVPAAVIFDLGAGDSDVRPGPEHGRVACEAAAPTVETGRVGAGTGATVGKWAGQEHSVPGGLGTYEATYESHSVFALAVVNAIGDVLAQDGSVLAGTSAPNPIPQRALPEEGEVPTSTVLTVVTTAARLDKREVRWLASRGADGITISVRPAHTRCDGDVSFAIAAPPPKEVEPDVDTLGRLATEAVAGAVRSAVD